MQRLASLYSILGLQFSDPELLKNALTHRSAASSNNERMEFLGDAILNFVISVELYNRFPQVHEGDLSRLRAHLVKGERLAEIARELSLGQYIQLGSGEMKSGGHQRASILADVFEAIIGAVYLDSGISAAHEMISRFFTKYLANCTPDTTLKDPKTRLQEFLQGRGKPLPDYKILSIDGQAHNQTFKIECHFEGASSVAYGIGSSRRKAEQSAAQKALELLEQ